MSLKEKIRYVLVDDEEASIIDFQWESSNCQQHVFEEVMTFQDPRIAVEELHKLDFDILFLDIEMPNLNGFDVIDALDDTINCKIVFLTAYDEFAIQAFKVSAFDYLLKPVSEEELTRLATKYFDQKITNSQIPIHPDGESLKDNSLAIYDGMGYMFVPLNEIIRFEADSNYTHIYTETKKYFASKSLVEYKKRLLETKLFIQPHRSHLVQANKIQQLIYSSGKAWLKLSDEALIPVSKRRLEELKQFLPK